MLIRMKTGTKASDRQSGCSGFGDRISCTCASKADGKPGFEVMIRHFLIM